MSLNFFTSDTSWPGEKIALINYYAQIVIHQYQLSSQAYSIKNSMRRVKGNEGYLFPLHILSTKLKKLSTSMMFFCRAYSTLLDSGMNASHV